MPRRAAVTPGATASPANLAEPIAIVGVGASAGGLEAFSQLLHALPDEPGISLVLIQHQSAQHESALTGLLSAQTTIPVVLATDGARVEPNHVYVNPPDAELRLDAGVIRLTARRQHQVPYLPIDAFFRSLAGSAADRSVAVIMSGTASDGSDGLREIKAAGGITIAQRPDTAKYDGMPRAAIATGLIDLVLSPEEIAAALVQMGRHQYLREPLVAEDAATTPDDRGAPFLARILALLRAATGIDFRQYKRPTIQRRISRRMALLRLTKLEQYVRHLEKNPDEIQALFHDVLILVTRFFRDPEVFAGLARRALPAILAARRNDEPLRAWIAGCSSGEEAYSLAILLFEFLGEHELSVPIQIFATDVSELGIERARHGAYPSSIEGDVSAARLRRFFVKSDGGYRVVKAVRDVLVFARHDVTRDPPFSRMDLILCRNLLIYLNAAVQQKVMSLFHYALKPSGFLLLGSAETVGQNSDLFHVEDKRIRLYTKKLVGAEQLALPTDYAMQMTAARRVALPIVRGDARAAQNEADRLVHDRFAPPGVIVDGDLQIVQFRGHTGPYLEPAPGDPTMNVLKMARDGLVYGLRTALHTARRSNAPVRRDGLRVERSGTWRECALEVVPLTGPDRPHFLVLFHDGTAPAAAARKISAAKTHGLKRERDLEMQIASLQRELAASRDYLQPIIQELEAANEELQSANEEVLSANEELQSTNEELNTVNDELRARNEELSRVNSDLENLLASVHIAIVIVARDLRIRRFTPMAERVLNLIAADVGRPIGQIKPNIDCPDLEARIHQVLDTVTPQEFEVRDRAGHRFSLRIRPYKDVDNRIEGAVLALFELHAPVSGMVA